MKRYFILLVILFSNVIHSIAQSRNPFDSTSVASYNDRFVASLFFSYRDLKYNLIESFPGDTTFVTNSNFISPTQLAMGVSLSYDKLSISGAISLGASTQEVHQRGNTYTTNLGFSVTTPKQRFEIAFRKYTGFYDSNTSLRDTNWVVDSSVYFQRPEMSSWLIKVKGFYFFNDKTFSYGAAYVNNYRQLKSKGSWFLMGDLYYHEIYSPNYFLSRDLVDNWHQLANLNYLNFYGVNFGGGYTYNLVLFKSLYLNLLFGVTLNAQQRSFSTADGLASKKDFHFGLSGSDGRAALGINTKSFFISLSGGTDFTNYKWKDFSVESRIYNVFFNVGYRFKVKETEWIKKMKENKFYKML